MEKGSRDGRRLNNDDEMKEGHRKRRRTEVCQEEGGVAEGKEQEDVA